MVKYKAISLSSGSAKGLLQLGCLHAAEINGMLNDVKIFAGCSVGALISLLLAVGWKPVEIFSQVCSDDLVNYINTEFNLQTSIKNWGFLSQTKLREYMSRMIVAKWGGIPSFKDLHNNGIVYICNAFRLKSSNPKVYFNHHSHPNMSCLDAALLSSAIPFIFQAQHFENNYYIDGGAFDLNPVQYVEQYMSEHNIDLTPKCILGVSLEQRNSEEEKEPIQTMVEFVKEIAFLAIYIQDVPLPNDFLDMIVLESQSIPRLQLMPNNTEKIQWFIHGLHQGLKHYGQEPVTGSRSSETSEYTNE
jgi:predicted acylesterase/phospholipase RssA